MVEAGKEREVRWKSCWGWQWGGGGNEGREDESRSERERDPREQGKTGRRESWSMNGHLGHECDLFSITTHAGLKITTCGRR